MTYAGYYDEFALGVVTAVRAPATLENRNALVAWIGGEAGWSGRNVAVKRNNPLNIKLNSFRSYGVPVDGIQYITNVDDGTQAYGTFTAPERGAAATASYLQRGTGHGYDRIIAALASGIAPLAVLDAIARSDWAASHYGLYQGHNHLHDNYAYVVAAHHPLPHLDPAPQTGDDVTFATLYAAAPLSIEAPKGTVLQDFTGKAFDTLDADTHLTVYGKADAHDGRFIVRLNTGHFYPDGKARPSLAVAVIPGGTPE